MSAIAENVAAPMTPEQLLAAFRALSTEEMAALWTEIQRGVPAGAPEKPPAAAPAVRKPRPSAPAPPTADAGEAPSAASYRVASVKEDVCVGRRFAPEDKRWKPAIFGEEQCGRAVEANSDLCPVCKARLHRYTADPSPKAGWLGRVTEDPLDWCHMLGTAWAAKANPRFGAGSACVSESASVASAPAKPKANKDAEKAAAKAIKDAEKEAAKAAKAAEKAAAKAAADAAVQKVKAEAAAKKAAAAPAVAAAKADTAAPAALVAHKIICVGGEMYAIRGTNAYEYNALDDSVGGYVGQLSADENAVDTAAPELTD